jgi:low affinity Fe/Cu permease
MNPTPQCQSSFNLFFRRFAHLAAEGMGSAWAFLAGLFLILIWMGLGPQFNYSADWQLVVNTGTTIVTFLMVFLIQHTQNRDAKVMQMKLDELIRALATARTELVQMEELSDEQLQETAEQFRRERERAMGHLERRKEARRSDSKKRVKARAAN